MAALTATFPIGSLRSDGTLRNRQGAVVLRAGSYDTVEMDGWRMGLLAGEDCWLPEAARLLQLRDADLIFFLPRPAVSEWDQLAGPWQLIQQTQCYGIEASPTQPRILAPCELTPGETGILGTEADLDLAALRDLRRRYPLRDHLRPDIYLRHFPW